jgi:hypothetical protein
MEHLTVESDGKGISTSNKYRVLEIKILPYNIKQYGIWRVIWGTDIFINDVPFLKCIVLANILVWLAVIFWH